MNKYSLGTTLYFMYNNVVTFRRVDQITKRNGEISYGFFYHENISNDNDYDSLNFLIEVNELNVYTSKEKLIMSL